MDLSELIEVVGDENVTVQPLDQCATALNYSAKLGTKITFGTDMMLTTDGTKDMGLVVWLPRAKTERIIAAPEQAHMTRYANLVSKLREDWVNFIEFDTFDDVLASINDPTNYAPTDGSDPCG